MQQGKPVSPSPPAGRGERVGVRGAGRIDFAGETRVLPPPPLPRLRGREGAAPSLSGGAGEGFCGGEGRMPIEIRMPALSPTMTEGNLAKWLKKEGDEVHAGDVIAEIETDKATMEYEAVDEGRIGRIIVPEGTQGVKVNQPIAVLLEEGEDEAALDRERRPEQRRAPEGPHPNPPPLAGEGTASPSPQAGKGTSAAPPPPQAGEG